MDESKVKAVNRDKLKAVVHFVISKCDSSRLGATRLNKILWYADTISHRISGASMTGETYVKRQHGPVPYHILGILRELEGEGAIIINERVKAGYPMREFLARREPNRKALSADEMDILDDVAAVICDNHSAASISDLTHDCVWEAANIGEEIPMHAIFAAQPGEVTPAVLAWADSVIEGGDSR